MTSTERHTGSEDDPYGDDARHATRRANIIERHTAALAGRRVLTHADINATYTFPAADDRTEDDAGTTAVVMMRTLIDLQAELATANSTLRTLTDQGVIYYGTRGDWYNRNGAPITLSPTQHTHLMALIESDTTSAPD